MKKNLRYSTEKVPDVVSSLDFGDSGVFNLGSDGVLRSFDSNNQVIDYRQLDPDQVKAFATKQIEQWKGSDFGVPPTLLSLVESPPDGRLVTDINALLNPDDSEKPVHSNEGDLTSRAPELEALNPRQPQICPTFQPCEHLSTCLIWGCRACYFPWGPPFGLCYVD